jgi:hypothetical protein
MIVFYRFTVEELDKLAGDCMKCLHVGLKSFRFRDGSEVFMCPDCTHGTSVRQAILAGVKRIKTSREILAEEGGYTTVPTQRPKPRADSLLVLEREYELDVDEMDEPVAQDEELAV